MTLSVAVVAALACPVCRGSLHDVGEGGLGRFGPLGCDAGHRFDVARQGHVTLAAHPIRHPGDGPEMLEAREVVQRSGAQSVITQGLVQAAVQAVADIGPGVMVVDVGAGTGHHLAAVLDAVPGSHGIAMDASSYAARRAARAHPRAGAVVADVTGRLPLQDDAADVLASVFAPRNGDEMARVLAPGGTLVVITPSPKHMGEVLGPLGLLRIDPGKPDRVDVSLAPAFRRVGGWSAQATVTADRQMLVAMISMGPNAFHHERHEIDRLVAGLQAPTEVTIAVDIALFQHAS